MGPALRNAEPPPRFLPPRRLLAALLAASLLSSFLLGFRARVHPLERGIDASYVFAATHASGEGLRFGRDFVSTFGPYAYFIYASDVSGVATRKFVAEILLVALAGVACALFVAGTPGLGPASALGLAILLTYVLHAQGNSIYGDEYRWLALVLLLLLLSIREGRAVAKASLFTASALGGFFLLVKLSLGFGALLTLAAGSLLSSRLREIPLRAALLASGASLGLALGWVGHQGTLEGIESFLATARPVVSGYSSAMSLSPEGWEATALCFAAYALLIGVGGLSSPSARTRLTAAACAAPLFVAWKHAMVRQDALHVRAFVLLGLVVACLLLVDALAAKRIRPLILLGAALPALFAPWWLTPGPEPGSSLRALVRRLAAPFRPGGNGAPIPDASLEKLRFSRELRETIGDSPVDLYPWESVYVAANDLDWRNRPSPASFATYAPELDAMNARFFASRRRPRYVLWHQQPSVYSVDGRHLFWDEPETLRTLLGSYGLTGGDSVFLLEALDEPRLEPPRVLHVAGATWDEWIPLPDAEGALLAAAILERPWWMPALKLLLREDPVYVSVRFEPGDERTYRFVPDQAPSGLWMSPLPRDLGELRSILRGNFSRPRPRAIRFSGGRGGIVVSWWQVRTRPR